MTRKEVETQVTKLFQSHSNILLEFATGVGKSKNALNRINTLVSETDFRVRVIIVVAEVAHIKNWIAEFNKWYPDLISSLRLNLDIICYASLKNYRNENLDLLVLDECHHIDTEIRLDILRDITAKSVLGLSATTDTSTKDSLREIFGEFYVYTIDVQQAIDWDILPTPKFYVIGLELDNSLYTESFVEQRGSRSSYVTISTTYDMRFKYLRDKVHYPDLKLNVKCTSYQKYLYLCQQIEYYKSMYIKTRNEVFHNIWMNFGSQRKAYLGGLKTNKARELISSHFGESRYICFCASIDQAEILNSETSIHSYKNSSADIIQRFNDKQINSIFAVKMLQEGQNLVDIEKGLIVQLDGKERAFIQKSGRILRASNPEIYIIYFKNTKDEDYLNKALEGISPDYIYYE